jgi:uncharacterized membrane protein YraQ (UPF0718 family)
VTDRTKDAMTEHAAQEHAHAHAGVAEAETPGGPPRRGGLGNDGIIGAAAVSVAFIVVLLLRDRIAALLDLPGVSTWSTVFVSLVVQAVPFLVLGVLLSALLVVYVPQRWITAAVPTRTGPAIGVAGLSGAVLPGCECASVPLAAGLVRRGVPQAAALAFLLSAPAINPVVLAATAVAFPGRPEVVLARFLASLGVAVIVAGLWARFGNLKLLKLPFREDDSDQPRFTRFRAALQHDMLHAGGFLVLGGAIAATVNTAVPTTWIDALAENLLLSILVMGLLAVAVSICSEADAFVAASFAPLPLPALLAFMVVGPAVDIKLVAMQSGWFGRSFTVRFAPLTFVVALVASLVVGSVLL